MRELVFKNIISLDSRKRDLFISDTVSRNGVTTVTKRHSVYIINKKTKFETPQELMTWHNKLQNNKNQRHIFIFKKRDTNLKKDSFICDVVGKFYAVVQNKVYSISFKHSFEIDFCLAIQK